MASDRSVIATMIGCAEDDLVVEPSYRRDVTLYRKGGDVYCAPTGWRRPPARWRWQHVGHARGRPVFVRKEERYEQAPAALAHA
jgi:hypothetical protein